jgi:hypothetical protein
MKVQLTASAVAAASALSFFLGSAPVVAAEVQFNVPDTARARESADLLGQTAQSFQALAGAAGTQLSSVWLYPTGDADTVFAHYTLSSNDSSTSPSQHLALLTVREKQIVEVRELSEGGVHWSAAIGNGHTSESTPNVTVTHGAPASPHWTAAIGTGITARSISVENQPQQHSVAGAPWSSKIGTGHASESNERPSTKTPAVVAGTSQSE